MTNLFVKLPLLLGTPSGGSATGGSGQMVTTFITFGLVILIFYFLIIRPQNRKQKKAKEMLKSLKKGDKAVTIGGIHGTVVAVKEQTTVLKVDDTTKLEFTKSAIASVVSEEKAVK